MTMNETAFQHLTAGDPILGDLIAKVGPCGLEPDHSRSPFQALAQAVAHQQLNGKAANTILGRFMALFPPELEGRSLALKVGRMALIIGPDMGLFGGERLVKRTMAAGET